MSHFRKLSDRERDLFGSVCLFGLVLKNPEHKSQLGSNVSRLESEAG